MVYLPKKLTWLRGVSSPPVCHVLMVFRTRGRAIHVGPMSVRFREFAQRPSFVLTRLPFHLRRLRRLRPDRSALTRGSLGHQRGSHGLARMARNARSGRARRGGGEEGRRPQGQGSGRGGRWGGWVLYRDIRSIGCVFFLGGGRWSGLEGGARQLQGVFQISCQQIFVELGWQVVND